ncbi:MAG: hypothetical protein ACFCUR_07790 [Rhodomicrobiaceae bacterium]
MEQLFTSGRVVDLILALMIAEYIALWLYLGRSVVALRLAGYLASGAFLLLALRVALTDGGWIWIALFLAAAFTVHLLDLRRRLIEF